MDNVIYVADFNVIDVDEPHFYPGWSDAWKTLSSKEPERMSEHQYSFDCEQNKHVTGPYRSRLDRVLYLGPNITPVDFSLIKLGDPHPSDHFGMLCKFEIKPQLPSQ